MNEITLVILKNEDLFLFNLPLCMHCVANALVKIKPLNINRFLANYSAKFKELSRIFPVRRAKKSWSLFSRNLHSLRELSKHKRLKRCSSIWILKGKTDFCNKRKCFMECSDSIAKHIGPKKSRIVKICINF